MNKQEIEEKVISLITEQLSIEKEDIKLSSNFINDLGADSLDAVEIIMLVEDKFDLKDIPDKDADMMDTIESLVNYIDKEKND